LCYYAKQSSPSVIIKRRISERSRCYVPLPTNQETTNFPGTVQRRDAGEEFAAARRQCHPGHLSYCAVGCGQLIFSKGGELIDIEGDPDSPISTGHLCPKGANAYQLSVNSHRVRNVLYRAPYSDQWETKTMEWALDQIAQRVKTTRDADFTTRDEQGRLLNSVRSIGSLGGATIDNEENYLIKKLLGGGLGVVSIENQARI